MLVLKKRYRVQRGKINASAAPTNLLSLGVSILHLKIGKLKERDMWIISDSDASHEEQSCVPSEKKEQFLLLL